MRVTVENEQVDPELVTIQSFGFAKPHPESEGRPYTLALGLAAANKRLEPYYRELAEDDEKYGEGEDDPLFLKLRELSWPSLNILNAKAPELTAELYRFAAKDLLDRIFAERSGSSPYAINSIDEVTIEGREIVFSGKILDLRHLVSES